VVAPPPVAVATAPVAPATPAPTPAGPNPAAQAFVDQVLINGVMLGAANSQRILIKGQSYGIGDPVNHDLQLKLAAVLPHDIIFVDGSGIQYHKRY
jgi:hypothetical protein